MAAFTLDEAKQHLAAWMAADLAVSLGQSYKMADGVLITRADATVIRQNISVWQRRVRTLEGGSRTKRVVLYDI